MIAGLKPYPNMKDSGVEWLGEVPEHWGVDPIARHGSLFKGSGGSKEDEVEEGVPCVRYGDLYTSHEFFIQETKAYVTPERAADYTPIRFGDVLFAASGETIADIGRSAVNLMEAEACCGGDVLVFRPRANMDARFLGYAADSPASRHQKACMGRGFTVVHIYGSELKRLALPVPPLPEQTAIVRFLDYADRRIRRYIRAKKTLIKLLEEHKQAVIHRAVTRGLDPDVPLKDSGVEWLGDVPGHWQVERLGRMAKVWNGGTPSRTKPGYWNGGSIPWLASSKVNDGLVETPSEMVTERALQECSISLVPRGAVIIGLIGQGKTRAMAAMLGIDACINQNIAAIVPHRSITGQYLLYFLKAFYRTFREFGRGGNQAALNCEIVANWRIAVPSLEEQHGICQCLGPMLARTRRAEEEIARQIQLLREYRTRLIADVVTGKLDVRKVATRLPNDEAVDQEDDLDEDEPAFEDAKLDAELQQIET